MNAHVDSGTFAVAIEPSSHEVTCRGDQTLLDSCILIGGDPAHPFATPPAPSCKAIHDEYGVDYAMIPDTTHFLQIEKPEACRRALRDFIARLG